MHFLSFTAIALSCTSVSAAPSRFVATESRVVDPEELVYVRIALAQRNLHRGYDHVMAISDPSSSAYGKHWSAKQIEEEFSPSQSSIDAVLEFLHDAGFSDVSRSPDSSWVVFPSTVESVKDVFGDTVEPSGPGNQRLVLQKYAMPSHVEPHIDFIALSKRTQNDSNAKKHKKRAPGRVLAKSTPVVVPSIANPITELGQCGRNITPPCIQALYGVPPPAAPYIGTGELGVYEDYQQYSQVDLDNYFTTYAPEIKNGTGPTVVDLGTAKAVAQGIYDEAEPMLDLTMVYGLLGPAKITYYDAGTPSTADVPFYSGLDYSFVSLLDAVDSTFCTQTERDQGYQCGGQSLTKVLSVSFGTQELFNNPEALQTRICNEFMKLSLQGHTILVASGDYGVSGNPGTGNERNSNGCIPQDYATNAGAYDDNNGTIFSPSFPATCPYVLSVGATMLYPDQSVLDAESTMELTAADIGAGSGNGILISSGGGFSNYFPRPSYQNKAVSSYLANHNPGYPSYVSNGQDILGNSSNIGQNNGVYNRAGRALPDVSANGVRFSTFVEGQPMSVSGTSASTPLWASLVALINQKRGEIGKGPVGFINPTLYQFPELLLHDIKNGSNPGCGTNGFSAVSGWDPVSGLGTPNFPALLATFLALP